MLSYTPTPFQHVHDPLFEKAGVRVSVKREDLNHPFVSGNKWWKLKYNLAEAKKLGKKTLLTFGGAFSNHVYATAAAAHELGFKSIGIIRGEETLPLNPTLAFARSRGMKLHNVTRAEYRTKNEPEFIKKLTERFGDFYLIPEGGTNELALKGVEEFATTLGDDFDYVCCAVGTGGTLAGLIRGLPAEKNILGFAVLKGAGFLQGEIETWVGPHRSNWQLYTDYHFGGYGKTSEQLETLIKNQSAKNNLPLERVYTAKALAGIFDLVATERFERGSRLLFIHTGGIRNTNKP